MAPDVTAEIRWFQPGRLPQEVWVWFTGLGPEPVEQPEREDRYMLLPELSHMGIKTREGRLEIKRRTHILGDRRPGHEVEGRLEAWRKWALPLDWQGAAGPPTAGDWISVGKRRWVTVFDVDAGHARPVDGDAVAEGACQVEVCALSGTLGAWWTVGLEAPGDPEGPAAEVVERTAARIFGPGAGSPLLSLAHSEGYPGWLARACAGIGEDGTGMTGQ